MNVRDRWNEGRLLGLDDAACLRLFGPLPPPNKTDQVAALPIAEGRRIMGEALRIFKDFKNPNRKGLEFAMGLCRSHWLIKGRMNRPIEGQIYRKEWVIEPCPTETELELSWIACKVNTKLAIYNAVQADSVSMPVHGSLKPVMPADRK
jgi:hypothetical protein